MRRIYVRMYVLSNSVYKLSIQINKWINGWGKMLHVYCMQVRRSSHDRWHNYIYVGMNYVICIQYMHGNIILCTSARRHRILYSTHTHTHTHTCSLTHTYVHACMYIHTYMYSFSHESWSQYLIQLLKRKSTETLLLIKVTNVECV